MTSQEVCELAGISYRQLDWWVRRKFIVCDQVTSSLTGTSGSGCERRWSPEQAARVVRMAGLVRDGYVPARAAQLCGERQYTGLGWSA